MASDEEDSPPAEGDPPESEEGVVLSPDELDFTNDERVVELDDGRYVISPGDEPPGDDVEEPFEFPDSPDPEPTLAGPTPELTAQDVHQWLADRFDTTDSEYGFDITAKFEGSVRHQELFSNDIVTTFENLLVWYAKQLGRDTPVEEVLGILLFEAGVPIRYPPRALPRLIAAYDLSPENTIADLLNAVDHDGGVRFSR